MLMDEEVLGANVALQSFSPTYLTAGAINDCKIYGFGFQNGIQVKIEPANDIIVEDVSCQTPNLLKAKIKILPTAIYGPRSIIIVSTDGKTSALENAFDVTWQPIITSLLPNIGMAGEIVSVAIKGDNFIPTPNICLQRWIKPVANSKISYSAKILAKSTNVISSNEISCIFDLSSTQEVGGVKGTTIVIDDLLGAWDLVVSSIYLEGVKPNAFIIVPKPSILSIAPNKVMQGTTVEVEIFGANFQNGALLHCGDGVMIKKYDYSKVPNKLAISAKIGPTAKSGMRDVTVRNPYGGIKTLKNGIEILKLPIVIKKPTTPKIPQYP